MVRQIQEREWLCEACFRLSSELLNPLSTPTSSRIILETMINHERTCNLDPFSEVEDAQRQICYYTEEARQIVDCAFSEGYSYADLGTYADVLASTNAKLAEARDFYQAVVNFANMNVIRRTHW